MNSDTQEAIATCTACRNACTSALSKSSGEVSAALTDCAEACAASLAFLARSSPNATLYCGICSEIAEHCADVCEATQNTSLARAAELCRKCAFACNRISAPTAAQAALEPSGPT